MASKPESYKLLEYQSKTVLVPEFQQENMRRAASADGRLADNRSLEARYRLYPRNGGGSEYAKVSRRDEFDNMGYEEVGPHANANMDVKNPVYMLVPTDNGGRGEEHVYSRPYVIPVEGPPRRKRLIDAEYYPERKDCCSCFCWSIALVIMVAVVAIGLAVAAVVFAFMRRDSIHPGGIAVVGNVTAATTTDVPPQDSGIVSFDIFANNSFNDGSTNVEAFDINLPTGDDSTPPGNASSTNTTPSTSLVVSTIVNGTLGPNSNVTRFGAFHHVPDNVAVAFDVTANNTTPGPVVPLSDALVAQQRLAEASHPDRMRFSQMKRNGTISAQSSSA